MTSNVRTVLKTLSWIPVGLYFTQHFYTIKYVRGKSMQPTLNPEPLRWDDIVIFDRLSVKTYGEYRRGDIVSLTSPTDPTQAVVKRIVALEGDSVQTLPPYPEKEVIIPEGHAWVEGDESFRTWDSNRWGPIPLGLISAKLTFILWPLDRFGPLPVPGAKNPPERRGPAWRKHKAELDRERWRDGRVKRRGDLDRDVSADGR